MRFKRGDLNFVWLFAVIAGSVILLLAIFGAVRFGQTGVTQQDTEIARTLALVTEPMQAGFTSGRRSMITFARPVLIENSCFEDSFGRNELLVRVQERSNQEFESTSEPIRVENKYLFISDEPSREFYVFSVPIDFAFRIADVVIMDSQEYCFIGLDDETQEIKSTFAVLGDYAKFGSSNCTDSSISVCFGTGGCDINVRGTCNDPQFCDNEFETGRVERAGFSLDYVGNFLYPAIFSEPMSYSCNLRRIMYRQSVLSELYLRKTDRMSVRGCSTNIASELRSLKSTSFELSRNLDFSALQQIYLGTKSLKELENRGQCRVWS